VSPRVLAEGSLIFWFHSYDALDEKRASVDVGKGSQAVKGFRVMSTTQRFGSSRRLKSLAQAERSIRAAPGDKKYRISRDRTMLIWDPEVCGINDELCVIDYLDYLAPTRPPRGS